MNKLFRLSLLGAFLLLGACTEEQSDEIRRAEVEREVQQRLAAEREADELARRQEELEAREQELQEKELAAAAPTATPRAPRGGRRQTDEPRRSAGGRADASSYNTFYRKLEPHGAWFETDNYGYVWQPAEAESASNWRPYTNGRWVYTDAGWTWASDEPYGWATYHYGRWTRLRGVGWVWVPGDQWAPAWVSWRTSDDYVGWAPLPPEARFERGRGIQRWADSYYEIGPDQYVFVPVDQMGADEVRRSVVPRERNVTIINNTVNVTNITYQNTVVVNQGPDFENIRRRSRRPIERMRLERQTTFNEAQPRPILRGEVIAMPAPEIIPMGEPVRPPTVRQRLATATVDLGWAAMQEGGEQKKLRRKMKAEATPPPDAPPPSFEKPVEAAAPAPATSPAGETSPAATAAPAATATPAESPAPAASPIRSPRGERNTTPTPAATASPAVTPVSAATAEPAATPSPAATTSPAATAEPSPTGRRGGRDRGAVNPSPSVTPVATATLPPATPSPSPAPAVTSTPSAESAEDGDASGANAPDGGAAIRDRVDRAATEQQQPFQAEQAREAGSTRVLDSGAPTPPPRTETLDPSPTPDAAAETSDDDAKAEKKRAKKERKEKKKKKGAESDDADEEEGESPAESPSPAEGE